MYARVGHVCMFSSHPLSVQAGETLLAGMQGFGIIQTFLEGFTGIFEKGYFDNL